MPVRLCPVTIGRDDLIALAERRVHQVAAGRGHLLLLAGEAGIGKTRLLGEIRARAVEHGFAVLDAAAYPRDVEVAGGVLADLVRAGADPAIADRLAAAGAGGDAYARRRALSADLAGLVGALAAPGRPLLVTCEDLHWADDLTLEVLDRVARRLADRPMLIVGTYRSNELYPRLPMRQWRAGLLTRRLAEEATLERLDPAEMAAMCAAITDSVLPEEAARALYERSDGIPLHVEELLAAAVAGPVPETLADAILASAASLTPAARRLAGAAAVIGRSFDVDLLTAAVGDPPDTVDAGLRELVEQHVVAGGADGVSYDFRHALIRDALYADLPPLRRRELHGRVADAAARAGIGDAFLSDQYERAQRPAEAYRHALAAAARAVEMSAHREAVELYRRAQRTMPTATPTGSATPPTERAGLLARLAAELAATDDNAAAATAYEEAWRLGGDIGLVPDLVAVRHLLGASLAERVGLLDTALARAESGDIRVRILAALSAAHMLSRHLDKAIDYGERARPEARGASRWNVEASLGSVLVFAGRMDEGWPMLEGAIRGAAAGDEEVEAARGYRMIGSSASVLVEYDLGRPWLREGIAYADRTERFNDRNYMVAHLAHVHWAIGEPQLADWEARRALADGAGGITTRITALHVLGYLALSRGDWTEARASLDEARELGEQMNELQRLSPALWGLAEVELRTGRPAAAVEFCERGYAESAAVADAAYLFPYLVTGVRARLATGDLTAARQWHDRCASLLRRRAIPGTLPAIDHATGLIHLAEGQTGKARTALEAASAGWDARGRAWEGIQALLDRARCAVRSRRPRDASTLGSQARSRAAAAGMTVLLDGEPATSPVDETPLTAREIEVARLVAGGATNRQIAEALSIAPKTVAAHMEHILTKLGAARRAEIAAWVVAAGRDPGRLGE